MWEQILSSKVSNQTQEEIEMQNLGLPGFALGMTEAHATGQVEVVLVTAFTNTHGIPMFSPYLIIWKETVKIGTHFFLQCAFPSRIISSLDII